MNLARISELVSEDVRRHLNLPQKIFVGGAFIDSPDTPRLDVFDPSTGNVIATIPDCGEVEIDLAVKAARKAFEGAMEQTQASGPRANDVEAGRLVRSRCRNVVTARITQQWKKYRRCEGLGSRSVN
jgi:acyl-CoA reductase-like NAD-dependent aldehyde dehydrogenase